MSQRTDSTSTGHRSIRRYVTPVLYLSPARWPEGWDVLWTSISTDQNTLFFFKKNSFALIFSAASDLVLLCVCLLELSCSGPWRQKSLRAQPALCDQSLWPGATSRRSSWEVWGSSCRAPVEPDENGDDLQWFNCHRLFIKTGHSDPDGCYCNDLK